MVCAAKDNGFTDVFVPAENSKEASVIDGINVYSVGNICEVINHLNGIRTLTPLKSPPFDSYTVTGTLDFSDVKGQRNAKRALEIACAGGHNVLLIGPPGTGKSMLAKRIPSILPGMNFEESVETTKIHSVSGILPEGVSLIRERPFRSPHHTMSAPSLVGGGKNPLPGEVSISHNGVLFLDELPEFTKSVTESLRQPLEDGKITITRTMGRVTYPCSFMLICAMNPCKCGYYGHPTHKCSCKESDIKKYLSKISGPLLDRMDIQVEVPSLEYADISSGKPEESSENIRRRVEKARKIAEKRFEGQKKENGLSLTCNAQMESKQIREYCVLNEECRILMEKAFTSLGLSARGHDRILKIARTIADLDGKENIEKKHITEAISLRTLDKKYF